MKALLERLELAEANYSNDLEYRKRAMSFIDNLKAFLPDYLDMLIKDRNGFYVLAEKFWDDPIAKDLYVFFAPKGSHGSNVDAGVGKFKGSRALLLPFLNSSSDLSNIVDRIGFNSSVIVHELIHLMDKGYLKGSVPNTSTEKLYYNHASEWNAFWQEGAFKAENLANNPIINTKERWKRTIGLTFDEFKKRINYIWDKGFISNMDDVTSKKFDKRLYQLWLEISKKIPKE